MKRLRHRPSRPTFGGCTGQWSGIELHDGEARNALEVTGVQCHDCIAKMQRGHADGQILECDLEPLGLLLAFDAPHQSCDVERYRMYGHILAQPLNELQPPLLVGCVLAR